MQLYKLTQDHNSFWISTKLRLWWGMGKGPPPTPDSTGKTSQDLFQCPGFSFCWLPSPPVLQGGQRGAIIITSGSLSLTPKMLHILKIKWPEGTFDPYKKKPTPFAEPINVHSWLSALLLSSRIWHHKLPEGSILLVSAFKVHISVSSTVCLDTSDGNDHSECFG